MNNTTTQHLHKRVTPLVMRVDIEIKTTLKIHKNKYHASNTLHSIINQVYSL